MELQGSGLCAFGGTAETEVSCLEGTKEPRQASGQTGEANAVRDVDFKMVNVSGY